MGVKDGRYWRRIAPLCGTARSSPWRKKSSHSSTTTTVGADSTPERGAACGVRAWVDRRGGEGEGEGCDANSRRSCDCNDRATRTELGRRRLQAIATTSSPIWIRRISRHWPTNDRAHAHLHVEVVAFRQQRLCQRVHTARRSNRGGRGAPSTVEQQPNSEYPTPTGTDSTWWLRATAPAAVCRNSSAARAALRPCPLHSRRRPPACVHKVRTAG